MKTIKYIFIVLLAGVVLTACEDAKDAAGDVLDPLQDGARGITGGDKDATGGGPGAGDESSDHPLYGRVFKINDLDGGSSDDLYDYITFTPAKIQNGYVILQTEDVMAQPKSEGLFLNYSEEEGVELSVTLVESGTDENYTFTFTYSAELRGTYTVSGNNVDDETGDFVEFPYTEFGL